MSFLISAILDLVFPRLCMICGREGWYLCLECRRGLRESNRVCCECNRFSRNGKTHKKCLKKNGLDGLISIYDYEDEGVRGVVETIKFGFNRELIKDLRLKKVKGFDLVIPVPLHRFRENWRGFNQAELLARRIGGKRMVLALKRVRNTKQQARLSKSSERKLNVRDAFDLKDPIWKEGLRGVKVLLIDDVFTTGESMKECCRVLKTAGVREVWGWVLAR